METRTVQDGGVYFECKRYKETIPKNEIISKIAELSIRPTNVEAWFLCATSEVSAQTGPRRTRARPTVRNRDVHPGLDRGTTTVGCRARHGDQRHTALFRRWRCRLSRG